MSSDYERALGRKIASGRKRRGLSQKEFAALLGRSEAWLSQVERGVRRIDRMTVLGKVADVLGVPVAELAAEAPLMASPAEDLPSGADRLRLLLSTPHALRAFVRQARNGAPADVTALGGEVERAWGLVHRGAHAELTELLEALVPRLESAARVATGAEQADTFRLLAGAYQAFGAALANMAEPEAAWVAIDRAVAAAERAGDPLLMAAGAFRLSVVFLGVRRFAQAADVSGSAAEALAHGEGAEQTERLALRGALTLQRALVAARLNLADDAYAFLRTARDLAEQVGAGRNDYNTEFGPANVSVHEVSVAVGLGDAGVALRAAKRVDVSVLSEERQARFHIDIAKAHAQRRQVDDAVSALLRAQESTPQLVRAMPSVGQLVADLLLMGRPPSEALLRLAEELGVDDPASGV
ncbi:helix-turn-helix domain-containing protein [Streptomyces sp. NPDC004042]|uniref:helix-turn-helix domain-containing protein n=1 Tax=Streptomyces sp. NPDC004042 TaxID=3154451 RepID=UPI0033BEEF96